MDPGPTPRRSPSSDADEDETAAAFEALDALNALIGACNDGELCFRLGADQARSTALAAALVGRADAYRSAADRLRAHVLHLGATPEDGGSTAGAMRRGWRLVRSRLSAPDDEAIREDCEREEESLSAAFREALESALPEPTRGLVAALQARVSARHAAWRRIAATLDLSA